MHTVQLLRAFERRFVIFIIGKKSASTQRDLVCSIITIKTVLGLFSLAYDYNYPKNIPIAYPISLQLLQKKRILFSKCLGILCNYLQHLPSTIKWVINETQLRSQWDSFGKLEKNSSFHTACSVIPQLVYFSTTYCFSLSKCMA